MLSLLILRLKRDPVWLESDAELSEDYIIVRGLKPGEIYEFKVVAVDGEYMTESHAKEVEIPVLGMCQYIVPSFVFKTHTTIHLNFHF